MVPPPADQEIVKTIRLLAARINEVGQTKQSMRDMWYEGLKKDDICEAICDWIDKGKPVQEIVTKYVPERVGEPAYVIKPIIEGKEYYVKVTITNPDMWNERLLIISSHKQVK